MPGTQDLTGSEVLEPGVKASLATLVAHLLLHEVDPSTLEILRQDDVLEVLEKLEPDCRDYLAGEWSTDDFEQAAVEYCRLFVLPEGVSPYASAWLGGDPLVAGPRIAARIDEVATSLGVENTFGNPPSDHLGVLLTLAAQAWQAGPEGEPLIRELAEELLLPWTPAFSRTLRQKTDNPLYRALGSLLGQLSRSVF